MTRRGALAYYLTAWICGSVFMSLCVWLRGIGSSTVNQLSLRTTFGILLFCFYGLILGAGAALLDGFLLRQLARRAHWNGPGPWVFAGASLAIAVVGVLGMWGRHISSEPRIPPGWAQLLTFGPKAVLEAGLWLAIPAGAATAFVLYRVHRAFASPQQGE